MIFLLLLLNHVNTQQLEHWAIQRNEEERAADLTEIAYTDAECLAFVDEMSAKSRHFRRRLLGRAMRGKPVRIREMTIVLCLVLDNCTLHHSEKVKQYVSNMNIKLENLPRYSPDFNPIELCSADCSVSHRATPRGRLAWSFHQSHRRIGVAIMASVV